MEFHGLHGLRNCRAAEEAPCFQAWQMDSTPTLSDCRPWTRCTEHEAVQNPVPDHCAQWCSRLTLVRRSMVSCGQERVGCQLCSSTRQHCRPRRTWIWTRWTRIVLFAVPSARPSVCLTRLELLMFFCLVTCCQEEHVPSRSLWT